MESGVNPHRYPGCHTAVRRTSIALSTPATPGYTVADALQLESASAPSQIDDLHPDHLGTVRAITNTSHPVRGAPRGIRKLAPEALERLAERLQDEQGLSGYQEAQQWLEAEYGQPIPYSTVHEWVRYRLQAKLKRPRPSHPKKTSPRARNSARSSNER